MLILLLSAPGLWASTIVVIGDSLSDAYNMPREAGWPALLDQRLGEDVRVIDGAISGDTSAGAVSRVQDLLDQAQPQVLIVILGGNDGLRGLPPGQLERNLAIIVEAGKAAGAEVALMQIRLPPNLGPVYIERFETIYPRLVERHGITLIPFFLQDLFDQPGMIMDDGIHPTEAAQPLLAGLLEPYVRELLRNSQN